MCEILSCQGGVDDFHRLVIFRYLGGICYTKNIFSYQKHFDRLWVPPNLLLKLDLSTQSHQVPTLRISGALMPSGRAQGQLYIYCMYRRV
jgi:hypothetical protein